MEEVSQFFASTIKGGHGAFSKLQGRRGSLLEVPRAFAQIIYIFNVTLVVRIGQIKFVSVSR